MRANFPLIAVAALLAFVSSPGSAHAGRVILVSVDGLRPDALTTLGPAKAPTFHRLIREGAATLNARTDTTITVTLPNHTGMITSRGVAGAEGHRWIENGEPFPGMTLHKNRGGYAAGLFDVAHDHGLRTGLFVSKSKFSLYDISYDARNGAADAVAPDHGNDKIDVFAVNEDTAAMLQAFLEAQSAKPCDVAMLHFRDPDTAGHATNWDLASGSGYLEAVRHVDGLLGRLLDAVAGSETWIVLTADHGGQLNTLSHFESELRDNYTIPFLVWGPGVSPGADLYQLNQASRRDPGTAQIPYSQEPQPIRNADAGNLVLSILGLPPIPGSWVNAKQDLKWR